MNFLRHSSLFLIGMLLFVGVAAAQSPGGISTNNTLWLRSDVGVSTTTGVVSTWNDQSGANITGNFTVQPLAGTPNPQTGPGVVDAGINFNPYIRFNGSNNSLSSNNIFPGTSIVSNSNVTAFQVVNVKGGIVWLKWETDQVGSTARLGFENAAGRIRFDFPKAVPASAGQNVGVTNMLNKHALSTCYADASSSVNRLNGAVDNTIPIPGPGNFSAVSDKLVIGNENLLNLPAQVDLAEVILYKSTLTSTEINKIESYLAVKYGFTLDQSPANNNNYTASDGTVIWDRAANSGYANNITGIGRDDASGLLQKQSKSVNANGYVTLFNDTSGLYSLGSNDFPLTNAANPTLISADKSFFVIGDNGAPLTVDQCLFNGKAMRMQRIWKVQKTGNISQVTISVPLGFHPAICRNIYVSPDPAFPSSNTRVIPMVTTTGTLFYRTVQFSNNEYFTFGTDSVVIRFDPVNPTCANPNGGGLNTDLQGLFSATPQYSWNPSGQTTPNLVNVPGGTYELTITQGTCVSTYSYTLSTPNIPSAPFAPDTTICRGGQATLHVLNPQAGITYNWYDAVTGGNLLGTGATFTTPANLTADQIYYLEAADGNCRSPRSIISVNIKVVMDAIYFGGTICNGETFSFSVTNVNPGYTYEWYNAATGGTALATGTTFTTPALSNTTTYYALAINGVCPGNRVPATVNVTTVPPPAANGVSVCNGNTIQLSVNNPRPGESYEWYDVATGGVPLSTGVNFTTPLITGQTTFYVAANDGTCTSLYTPVTVSLIQPLDSPRVSVGTVTSGSVTFNWTPVSGATGYEISINGGPFTSPDGGPTALTQTVYGLANEESVSITVVPVGTPERCGNGLPGHAAATTFGQGFYMPTAFTPNDDNLNDIIRPILPGGSVLEYFTVFNRWGQQIYNTNKPGVGWNGKLKGKLQPSGSYVWVCRYRLGNQLVTEKGSFTLIY